MDRLDFTSFTSLTSFDWFLITLIAISVLLALRRGLVTVLFSLTGLIAGILLASWNYLHVAALLQPYFGHIVLTQVLTFVAILLIIQLGFILIGAIVKKSVHAVGLGFIDRAFGAVFGLFRGALFAAVILMILAAFVPDSPWIRSSRLAPYFFAGTHAVSFVVPETFSQRIASGANRLLAPAQHSPAVGSKHRSNHHQALRAQTDPGGE